MEKDFISIGKITNFFGIKGEAKVGFDNLSQIKNAKEIYLMDDPSKKKLIVKGVRFHKNFAIIKFESIDDINDIIPFKGQRIYISKKEALNKLQKDEFLIQDLIDCTVYDEKDKKIGTVAAVSSNSSQDLLNIKNLIGQEYMVPFVNEFFPLVDIKNKKITIKPIEGLIN